MASKKKKTDKITRIWNINELAVNNNKLWDFPNDQDFLVATNNQLIYTIL